MDPKVPRFIQIKYMICQDAVPHANPDSQMVGWNVGKFPEDAAGYKIDGID
jgi:hypothetical protein